MLSYRRQLSDDDLLAVTYYLLLQDRVEEALEYFGESQRRQARDALAVRLLRRLPGLLPRASRRGAGDRRRVCRPSGRSLARSRSRRSSAQARRDRQRPGARSSTPKTARSSRRKLAATEPGFDFKVEAKQREAQLPESDERAGELLPDGHRTAVQPQSVRAAVLAAVRAHPAEQRRRSSSCRKEAKSHAFAAARASCRTATCWSRSSAAGMTQDRRRTTPTR